MLKIWVTWIKYLAVLVIILVFKYFYMEYMPVLFVVALISLPIISLIYITIGIFMIKLNIKFEPEICVRDETIKFNIVVSNKSLLPFPIIKIKYTVPEKIGSHGKIKTLQINLPYSQNYIIKHNIICKYRGIYESKLYYVEIYDLFGFFKFRLKYKDIIQCTVVPRKILLSYDYDILRHQSNNNINTMLDSSDIIGTRKYEMGDDLKSVHWKHSAKLDELMVKEFQEENEILALIVMDLKSHYKDSETKKDSNSTDGIIETGIALALKCVMDMTPVDILWYDSIREVNCENLLSLLEFEQFFINISQVQSYNNDVSVEELVISQLDYNGRYTSIFLVCTAIDSKLVSLLCSLAVGIQINFVYFEIENQNNVEKDFDLMKYHGIRLWHIKENKIAEAFLN